MRGVRQRRGGKGTVDKRQMGTVDKRQMSAVMPTQSKCKVVWEYGQERKSETCISVHLDPFANKKTSH